jgi:hypothetical protein
VFALARGVLERSNVGGNFIRSHRFVGNIIHDVVPDRLASRQCAIDLLLDCSGSL